MQSWTKINQNATGKYNQQHNFPSNKKVLIYYKDTIVVGEYRSAQNRWYYHNAPIFYQNEVTHWHALPSTPMLSEFEEREKEDKKKAKLKKMEDDKNIGFNKSCTVDGVDEIFANGGNHDFTNVY